ncbi:MAG: hypothetical protein JO181_06980, partial [Solirubrobacterales bacterium]|nr:hypothetical protein [Solirubrobacterales bacterium]
MPPFRSGFVGRPALVKRLLDSRDAALALIVAPAGYGKTALVAEWAEADERPFTWITLDPRDGSPADLAGSVVEAFEEGAWTDRDSGYVLVLDDAHAIRPAVLKAVAMALLKGLGPSSQLVLASRTEPPLPVGRLRAHRELVEVRTADLVMTPAEAATLLRQAGLELDFEAVRMLSRRTEGWPVGLYLAALSLLEQGDAPAAVEGFDGEDHLVAEYFRDEFLAPLPRAAATFAVRTSVLDDLSGPVCDAMLRQSGSAIALGDLARSNLMLAPLDQSHERFRWHRMFRSMLRAELRRTEPELEPRLRRRASTWLQRHGDLDGAIGQAVAASDTARVGELLWANIVGYLGRGVNDRVQRWLRSFSADQVAG